MRIGAASTAILNVALLSFFIFQGLQSPFRKLGTSGYPKNAALPGHDPISGDIGEFAAFDPESMTGGDALGIDEDPDEISDSSIDDAGLSATGSSTRGAITGGDDDDDDDLSDPVSITTSGTTKTIKHPDVRETLESGDEPSTTVNTAGKPKGTKPTDAAKDTSSSGAASGGKRSSTGTGAGGAKDMPSSGTGSKEAAAGAEADPDEVATGSKDTAELKANIEEAEAEAEREAGEIPEEDEEAAPNPEDDIIPMAEDHFEVGSATDASYYLKYIKHDFRPWRKYGIPRIVKGVLWVDHLSERHDGWYPSKFGPGVLSGKGKIPYAILALMDTLRHYPGQIPDCDAIIQTSDFPCFLRSPTNPKPNEVPPPPIFGYNSDVNHSDIPFPDYTYWGHEYQHLTGPNKKSIHGWEQQWKFLANKWKTTPLAKRTGQVMWRGRTNDPEFPERDWLRRKFAACPETLTKMGRPEDAAVFNLVEPKLGLHDTCDFRYPMHIESHAWTTNTKQKMACGSVFVSHRLEYYEWFTRALKPGIHFVEVDPETICVDTATKIKHMNAQFEKYAKDIPPPGFSEDDHPGGALHDYPGSQGAVGAAKAASVAAGGAGAGQAATTTPALGSGHTEAGALHTQSDVEPTAVAAAKESTKAGVKPGRQDPTAGSATHDPDAVAARAAEDDVILRRMLQAGLPQTMKTSEVEKEASLEKPWLIAEASYAFVRDHIRMDDVRLYIRDALKEYASLQSGDVQPTWNADCYTGELLLEQFGFPHKTDRDIVTQAYPWLKEYNQEACKGKLSRKKYYAQLEAVKSGS